MVSGCLLFFLLFTGCKEDAANNTTVLKSTDLTELKYGSHASQSMDVFLPENRDGSTKTIVFVHGGFWISGDKAQLADLAKQFRDKGYSCAVINYRLSNTPEKNIHPAQINDLANAIAFIRSKAAEWKISPDGLGLLVAVPAVTWPYYIPMHTIRIIQSER